MMAALFRYLAFGLIFLTPVVALGSGEIRHIYIQSGEWQDQTNSDGTGLFWDLFRKVYEPVGINLTFDIVPYARSVRAVQKNLADAMVSAYPDEFTGAIFCDIPYLYDKVVAVYKKGKIESWKGEESLSGTIGWIRGYGYDQYLKTPVEFYEVNNHETGLKMLNADRLSFFITAENEIDDAMAHAKENNYLNPADFEIINPIMHLGLHLVFADTPRGRELNKVYDERMRQLIASGELEPIYKKWSTDYPIQEWKKLIPGL